MPYPKPELHVTAHLILTRGYLSDIVKVELVKSERSGRIQTCYTVFIRLREDTSASFDIYSADGEHIGGSWGSTLDDLANAIHRIIEAYRS